jgi:predicted nucleic acid-binding protein
MTGPVASLLASHADLVIDASVGVKWFVPEVDSESARHFLVGPFRLHAPVLFLTEFGQTLWKKVHLRGELSADEGRGILRDLLEMPIEFHSLTPLLEPAFEIAVATGRTLYDSVYLALATALGTKVVTADRKLFNALQSSAFVGEILWVGDQT